MSYDPSSSEVPLQEHVASEAVLTEAVRHVDIVHTSLAGMTAIVVMLLIAVALPVFDMAPVKHPIPFSVMILASFVGIGGLYFLNYRVHQHVTDQSRLTEVLVNSLGQGFLVFDSHGICGNVYSQACLDLLETVPAGKYIADVLLVPEDQRADFKDWFEILFQPDHALGFEDVIKFLPQYFAHSQKRRISLVYRPILRRDGSLMSVVVIATDQTEEFAAREAARHQQNYAEMICRIFKERNKFHATLAHLSGFLEATNSPSLTLNDSAPLLRQLHTLKASVKQFNLLELGEVIHGVENDLRGPGVTDDAIFRRELVQGRQKIAEALAVVTGEVNHLTGNDHEWRGNVREIEEADLYEFALEMQKKRADPALIQSYLRSIAAVPIRDCFRSFERELQELAGVMDKQIKPVCFEGTNPRVLTQPLQEFLFLLTHFCRNIMDHGIESPVTRMARGKDPAGQVTILTDTRPGDGGIGEVLLIVIGDDGNGIDPSRIRTKLATIDPNGAWRFEDDQTVIQRIFSWGVTTSDILTTISGRGVGMEAVDREIRKLGGSIRVSSELYKGSRFEIKLPYVLDISMINTPNLGKPLSKQQADTRRIQQEPALSC